MRIVREPTICCQLIYSLRPSVTLLCLPIDAPITNADSWSHLSKLQFSHYIKDAISWENKSFANQMKNQIIQNIINTSVQPSRWVLCTTNQLWTPNIACKEKTSNQPNYVHPIQINFDTSLFVDANLLFDEIVGSR